ncbi:MAG: heme A synthase [Cryomorphaceae bacterium]|nr:COX15/CtaA family protein [Flavobacteriales bacterium]
MQNILFRLAVASLTMVLLTVLAGSIVRMSGSGMGCPDWPKCFGYYIPPTDVETLTWKEGRSFKKGNMILLDERFYTAKSDFEAGNDFEKSNWELYTKHDYNVFNPVHTWIEFVNRFIGALTGLPVLAFFGFSLFYFRRNPVVTLLGVGGLALLGFVAWLGKLVVDGNLIPHSITYHMFSALGLVATYSFLAAKLKVHEFAFQARRDSRILTLGAVCVLLVILQIAMGTEVREAVDALMSTGEYSRDALVESLPFIFKIHRSFSIAVLLATGLFAAWLIRTRTISMWPRVLLAVVVLEVLAGMGLAYLGMPALLQPVHLLLAVVSFSLIVFLMVAYYRKTLAAERAV